MMRRSLMVLGAAVLIGACGAESEGDPTTTVEGEPGTTEEAPATSAAEPTTTAAPATNTAPAGAGTRENPVPAGETAVVGNYEVAVTGFEADATETVLAENEFNEPPPDGSVYSLIGLSYTYIGDETGMPGLDLSWSGVGASNAASDSGDCTTYPENAFDVGELFPGGTATSNVCLTVPQGDLDTLVLILEDTFTFEESRMFFALP